MKRVFFLNSLMWCFVILLSLTTFAQQKTRLGSHDFSAANNQNNIQSPTNITDATILRWDDGVYFLPIGYAGGATFEAAVRFPASLTGPLAGQRLTQVEIYINIVPNPCIIKIYDQGTPNEPGTLLHSQTITPTANSWNLITLDTPVNITGNDIWVGYEVTHTGYNYPCGSDDGPAVVDGDWLYDSGSWMRLSVVAPHLNYNWNIAAYIEQFPPCPVQTPENPNPANNATNVAVSGLTLSWSNGGPGTLPPTQVEVQFGPTGNMSTVYSGPPITQWAVSGTLNYKTNYQWKVINKIDTCNNFATGSFTTEWNPNMDQWCDDFTDYFSNWTIEGPVGKYSWTIVNSREAGGTAPELRMDWSPPFTGLSLIRSNVLPLPDNQSVVYSFDYSFNWYSNPSGIVVFAITYDGGATSTKLYEQINATRSIGPMPITGSFTTPASGSSNAQLEISYNGNSAAGIWDIFFDNVCLNWIIPVELTSFTATADYGVVELRWFTATETNNQGFEVQRSNGGEFWTIGFVDGHGTTTEVQAYNYTDRTVSVGSYSYRLKQVDYDGTYEYSNVVEVTVPAPAVYALEQNYPNPFNPSTTIKYSIAKDGFVKLVIYNMLGEEVTALVNGVQKAGRYEINFDASGLSSGIYIYKIESADFTSAKKLMLMK